MNRLRMIAFVLLTCVLLASCGAAVTQEELLSCSVANGVVGAVAYTDIVAPYSGTLMPFSLEAGDRVEAGDDLLSLRTHALVAPEEGVVRSVFAQPGQNAQDVLSRYGALLALEPAQLLRITATTDTAYNSEKTRFVHVGEMLYFRSTGADKEEGQGVVISVSGRSYVVDILSGTFDVDEALSLYREDDYDYKQNVGKGRVVRRDPVSVTGAGIIASVQVQPGDSVQPGQTLALCMGVDADPDARPDCIAPVSGVIGSLLVAPGQQVWKGQALARLLHDGDREIVAQVDEVDLSSCPVGSVVPVTLDTDESRIYECTVTEVSSLGTVQQNAAYYTVRLSLPAGANALLGQSAKIYLPR